MSEVGIRDVTNEQSLGSPDATLTAGQMMRNARESAGLHVAALAVSMKIPVKNWRRLRPTDWIASRCGVCASLGLQCV